MLSVSDRVDMEIYALPAFEFTPSVRPSTCPAPKCLPTGPCIALFDPHTAIRLALGQSCPVVVGACSQDVSGLALDLRYSHACSIPAYSAILTSDRHAPYRITGLLKGAGGGAKPYEWGDSHSESFLFSLGALFRLPIR